MADGMLSLSWNNHKATFCHILSTLRDKERYTDVTLACEGKFYPVHKLVLSTCSEYFEKMFEHTPCKHPVIVLNYVKPDELEALLSYMYAGVVSVAQNDLARLIKAAELLQIKGLAVPDEPPSKSDSKRTHSWSSRDDRSSPHPKRRRRDENHTMANQVTASQPSESPPSSPQVELENSWDPKVATNSEEQRSEDTIEQRLNESLEQRIDEGTTTKQENFSSHTQENVDETLVKEEVVEAIEDSQGVPGATVDYGVSNQDALVGCEDPSNKLTQQVEMKAPPPLPEAVVEALAGPSGMQGWLGTGDITTGFSMLEGYSEEGQDAQHSALGSTQQPQQMVGLNSDGARNSWRGPVGKTHQCPFCKYSTLRKDHITKHIRTHTGEKPFTCTFCNYSAASKDNLKLHVRTHTGEKPFTCPYCPFRASRKDSLQVHIRVHTGEKPYTCTKCPYRSSQRNALVCHMLKHKL